MTDTITLDEYAALTAKTPKQYRQDEHVQQVCFYHWIDQAARVEFPVLEYMHAIPNGGKRDTVTAGKMRAEGVRRGVLDNHLPYPVAPYTGLWIEFKSDKGRLSKDQERWEGFLKSAGHAVHVARHWTEAARVVLEYLGADEATIRRLTEGRI